MKKKIKILKPDFCIIGAGSGGLTFAAGSVQMGCSVVLLEHKKMGGDCLNYGCVPSKSLIAAAKEIHTARNTAKFGLQNNKSTLDFKKVHQHIHNTIKNIAPHDSVERFTKLGVKVIKEKGSFISNACVKTKNYLIKAKRFIIATGSSPFIPPIKGIDSVNFHTNETIFELKSLPKNLAIIGGGPIGIEMAQAFSRLGSDVSVLESFTALPKDDPEITKKLKTILRDEGVNLYENISINLITQNKNKVTIQYQDSQKKQKTLTASHLIIATGRRSNIKNLMLEQAQIKYTTRGIEVDKNLRTSNKKVYAIGDCIGNLQFTHVASYHAGLAIRNSIFGLRTSLETKVIPWVTYTEPELAHVGYQEIELKKKNIPYKTMRLNFTDNDRAQAEKKTKGLIKLLASPKGYVLGVTILGTQAGELIYPWVILIQNKLKLTSLTSSIAPYPTLNDLNKRIAGSFYKDKLFSNTVKIIVKFIMRWFR